jgi:hypothetical protein
MVPKRRTQLVLLAALLAVLATTLYYTSSPRTTAATAGASNSRGPRGGRQAESSITPPDVHLEALSAERPKPRATNRNLFRFRPPPPPPVAAARSAASAAAPPPNTGPAPPPPLPPIGLKLTGIGSQGTGPRLAFLTDPFGRSIVAREGETIEGRYKIVRVAESSVEISYLDGRGQQTLRTGP